MYICIFLSTRYRHTHIHTYMFTHTYHCSIGSLCLASKHFGILKFNFIDENFKLQIKFYVWNSLLNRTQYLEQNARPIKDNAEIQNRRKFTSLNSVIWKIWQRRKLTTTTSQPQHITTSPHHHASPHHHITTSPHHNITVSTHHRNTTSGTPYITTSPDHRITPPPPS